MRAVMIFLCLCSVGCMETDCYPNKEYATNQADKFCNQGNNNKTLCESLFIEANACRLSEDNRTCIATTRGIKTFYRIPAYECSQLEIDACTTKPYCRWSTHDSAWLIPERS